MLRVYRCVALTGLAHGRLEETKHGRASVLAGALVLHVEEVAGIADHAEVALPHMLAELARVLDGGVFITVAVDEQHRDVDVARRLQGPIQVVLEHLVDVEVHLRVLVAVQAADVPVVEALEQRRQVLADGVVDQVAHLVAITGGQELAATLQVVAHRFVDHRRERTDDGLLHQPRLVRQRQQGAGAAPGERHHVVGTEVLDQLEQDVRLGLLGEQAFLAVVRLGLAGIRLVVQHHVELRVQVAHRLGEGRRGGQRTIDQDDRLLGAMRAMELRVNPVLPLDIKYSDFWPHVIDSWRKKGYSRHLGCTFFMTGRHLPGRETGGPLCRSLTRVSTVLLLRAICRAPGHRGAGWPAKGVRSAV